MAGGTFESDTDGTFHCDIPGTFQSAVDGTFDFATDGTFQSDMGGTFGPLLSMRIVGNVSTLEGASKWETDRIQTYMDNHNGQTPLYNQNENGK